MVYVFLANGFEEIEAITPVDILRRAGIEVKTVGIGGDIIIGAHGISVKADAVDDSVDFSDTEMIFLPGGGGCTKNLKTSITVKKAVQDAYGAGKLVSAICSAPTVLASLGLLDGIKAVCYPGVEGDMGGALMQQDAVVVCDGVIITGRAAGSAVDFGLALVSALRGNDAAEKVAKAIYYEGWNGV